MDIKIFRIGLIVVYLRNTVALIDFGHVPLVGGMKGLLICNILGFFVWNIGVGKSCLLLQFTDKRFQPVHDLTIGKIMF